MKEHQVMEWARMEQIIAEAFWENIKLMETLKGREEMNRCAGIAVTKIREEIGRTTRTVYAGKVVEKWDGRQI